MSEINRPVRVLQIAIGGKTFSGVASYLYQQYKQIDKTKVHYDFLFTKENSMSLVMHDSVFTDSRFYELKATRKNSTSNDYGKITRKIDQILDSVKYDYIVVNTSVVAVIAACLRPAKKHGIKLIAHAHNTEIVLGQGAFRRKIAPIMKVVDAHYRKRIRKSAFYMFGCSEDAGEVTFGQGTTKSSNFMVVRDAIDLRKFSSDDLMRREVRAETKTSSDVFVIGNIGKLSKSKNQMFLLDIFSEIRKRNIISELWLIGDGVDKEMLEKHAEEMHVRSDVKFFGQRSDVNRLMQGMDSFVFTTLSEGLGIVAIEAQAAGLPTIVSDGVPDDVLLSELITKVPLCCSTGEWADAVLNQRSQFPDRVNVQEKLENAGYDMSVEAKKIEKFYIDNFGKRIHEEVVS